MSRRPMRATSSRRRSTTGGKKYDGRGFSLPKAEVPLRKREPGTPGTVECPDCGTTVPSLPTAPDRPIKHSPGGYTVNHRLGRGPCPNSGSHRYVSPPEILHPMWNLSEDGKAILDEKQARTRNLINFKIIAGRYDIAVTTLQRLQAKSQFVAVVAYLDHPETHVLQKLFNSSDVDAWMKERRIKPKLRRTP